MATKKVLCTHRPFVMAVKRIDLGTQPATWIICGEPYWRNRTDQRANVVLEEGEPVVELDWTNRYAGELPVTVTLKIPLEKCCKSIRAKHHVMKQCWMEKDDAILKLCRTDFETTLPHQTDERRIYSGMTLSLGEVDIGKATWIGRKEKLAKEDRDFIDIFWKMPRDIEILTCWIKELECDWSYLTPFVERCDAINRSLQQRAAPPPPAALPAPTPIASAPPTAALPAPTPIASAPPPRRRPPRMPFFPNGRLVPLGWQRRKKPVEDETDESALVSDKAEARAKAELQKRLSHKPSRSRDERKRSASVEEEVENIPKNSKAASWEEQRAKDQERLRRKILANFAAVRAKLDVDEDTDLETLNLISREARSLLEPENANGKEA
ncbi:hypothetical protein AC578_1135 [Pseudocercospora eumusae]|uniref:Uncharacterized protein n=1 Tax=Pseudocercospora eumusae TaxID=321146 RepID=A0A139HJT1_9PEZI|nr:hypothetical protein AC578_1135 [Pseudocercospora eumusae]